MVDSISSNISWKDREQYRQNEAASISNSTVQASEIREDHSQNGFNGDDFVLPDVNEKDEDCDNEAN